MKILIIIGIIYFTIFTVYVIIACKWRNKHEKRLSKSDNYSVYGKFTDQNEIPINKAIEDFKYFEK